MVSCDSLLALDRRYSHQSSQWTAEQSISSTGAINSPGAIPPQGAVNEMPQQPMPAVLPPLAGAAFPHPRTYQEPLPPKVLRIHDIVQIRVDETARMTADDRIPA